MKTTTLILLVGFCSLLASCSSSGSNGGMSKGLIGAASGGVLGSIIGDHLLNSNNGSSNSSSTTTAAGTSSTSSSSGSNKHTGLITGAAAGFAAGTISDYMARKEEQQKYLDGYNKGRSDAIKDLYWLKRDAERPSSDGSVQRRYYEVPVPEHVTTDGVLVEPRKVVIEVVE